MSTATTPPPAVRSAIRPIDYNLKLFRTQVARQLWLLRTMSRQYKGYDISTNVRIDQLLDLCQTMRNCRQPRR